MMCVFFVCSLRFTRSRSRKGFHILEIINLPTRRDADVEISTMFCDRVLGILCVGNRYLESNVLQLMFFFLNWGRFFG